MHFGRHTSTRHVWNNGCHNCPVQLINLPSPYNQSVSPLANTGYIPALHERPSFTVAQKGGSRMLMSLSYEAAKTNSTKRLPRDVFKSMAARLSRKKEMGHQLFLFVFFPPQLIWLVKWKPRKKICRLLIDYPNNSFLWKTDFQSCDTKVSFSDCKT